MPKFVAAILQKLTSEKFGIQITLLLLTTLVQSTQNKLDDQALELVRKALEE